MSKNGRLTAVCCLFLLSWVQLVSAQDTLRVTHKSDTPIVTSIGNSYVDTLFTIVNSPDSLQRERTVTVSDTIRTSAGHQFQAYLGGGYGSLGYQLQNGGLVSGSLLGLIELNYAYFFHPNVGVGIGLRFGNTTSIARLMGQREWDGVTDTDGETYNHTTYIKSWRERQTIHTLDIPVSLQTQFYFNPEEEAGMYINVGASLRLPVYNRYNTILGYVEDKGFYPATNLTLSQLHEFGERNLAGKGKLDIKPLAAGVFADLGFLFRVAEHTDLALGAYFQFTPTDINTEQREYLGFANSTFTFMNPYKGVLPTTEASVAHPWEAAIKLGVRVHSGRTKVNTSEQVETFWVPIVKSDTTISYITHTDTIPVVPVDTTAKKSGKQRVINDDDYNDHIIYFRLNEHGLRSYAVAELDNIVSELNAHPERDIVIDGHACRLGKSAYNIWLSKKRADAVAQYLVQHGISEDRLTIRYHGNKQPSDDKQHDLAKDRRVTVKVRK